MKSERISEIILILILLINTINSADIQCQIGCKKCSAQTEESTSICEECEDNFVLVNNRCKYTLCTPYTYYQESSISLKSPSIPQLLPQPTNPDESTETDDAAFSDNGCKAICNRSSQENNELGICEPLQSCSISYNQQQGKNRSQNGGMVENVYNISKEIALVVYPTYCTLIHSKNGAYLRDIVVQNIVTIQLYQGALFLTTTKNEVINWNFNYNNYEFVQRIEKGKLSKKTQLLQTIFIDSYITSYDEGLSLVYFHGLKYSAEQDDYINIPQFSYFGCSLFILDIGYAICMGKNLQISVNILINDQNTLFLKKLDQGNSCSNLKFPNSPIIQIAHYRNYSDSTYQFYIIQEDYHYITRLYNVPQETTMESVDFIQCEIIDIGYYPKNIKLIDIITEQREYFVLMLQLNEKIIFYNNEMTEILKFESASLTDFQYYQQEDLQPEQIKIFVLYTSLNLISTHIVDFSNCTIQDLTQFHTQIKNPVKFLSYYDNSLIGGGGSFRQLQFLKVFQLYVFSENLQKINVDTDETVFVVNPFSQVKQMHTNTINQMVYSDKWLILLSCSSDGSIRAWSTQERMNPRYLFTLKQQQDHCNDMIIYQNKWVVAIFNRSIVIFNIMNQFVTHEYIFQVENQNILQMKEQKSFITSSEKYILLFYDSQFKLLNGSDLQVITTTSLNNINHLISIYFLDELSIIIQTDSSTIQLYKLVQQDQNIIIQFVTDTNQIADFKSSGCDNLTFAERDFNQIINEFEILVGCQNGLFVILNSQLQISFRHQLIEGYPIEGKRNQINDTYIIFGYNPNNNESYQYFHYILDRSRNQGGIIGRGYSIQFNLGMSNVKDYRDKTDIAYLFTMEYSFFSLILRAIYRPDSKSISFGYYVFSFSKGISKFVNTYDGTMQYYGTQEGYLSFDTNNWDAIQKLKFNSSQSKIKQIKTSAKLGYLFVISDEVYVYHIHTNIYKNSIKFNDDYKSELVKNIIISEQFSRVIVFKTQQLIMRNYNTNKDSYFSAMKQISGVILDEEMQRLYIFGSSIKIVDLDLQIVQTILEEDRNTMTLCKYRNSYLYCQTIDNSILIYNIVAYQFITSIQIKYPNFKMYLDPINGQIFVDSIVTEVYDYQGNFIGLIESSPQDSLHLHLYGNYIAITTKSHIYLFTRDSLQFIKSFKPNGGGNLLGCYYIESYNLIVYYSDEIRYAQLYYFSLTTLSDDGYTSSTYTELGIGKVVFVFYDPETSRLNYVDTYGNLYSISLTSQRAFYNVINFDEFAALGTPKDYLIDYTVNNLYLYNDKGILYINYNLIAKYVVQQSNIQENYYFKLKDSTLSSNEETQYFLFDSLNTLYTYQNFSQSYVTYFNMDIQDVRFLDKYQLIAFIFSDQILIYTFDQAKKSLIRSNNFVGQIKDPKIRQFINNEVYVSTEQKIIQIDYNFYNNNGNWQQKITQFSQDDQVMITQILDEKEEKVLMSYKSGQVKLYDLILKEDTPVISSVINSYANNLRYTNTYFFITYIDGQLFQISRQNYSEFKSLNLAQLFNSVQSELNLLEIDEKNNRLFISFIYSKLIHVLSLDTFQPLTCISFPDNQFNRFLIQPNYIFVYSWSQINIYRRDDLGYVNKIRKSNYQDRILSLQIIDESKIILAINTLLEVYLLEDDNIQLIDSIEVSNPQIIDYYLGDTDNSTLRIIGFTDNSILEKRINLKLFDNYSKSSSYPSTLVKSSYSCYGVIDMQDRISGENLFDNIYNKNDSQRTYRISTIFGSQFRNLGFIPDGQFNVILEPFDIKTRMWDPYFNPLSMFKRTSINMINFIVYLYYRSFIHELDSKTKFLTWQDITIKASEINQMVLLFQNMKRIVISNLTLQNINYNDQYFKTRTKEVFISQQNQTLFMFKNCDTVIIENIHIHNVTIWQESLLFGFQNVQNVIINSVDIHLSNFYQIFSLQQGSKVTMKNIWIYDNKMTERDPPYYNNSSERFMISIVGYMSSELSSFYMKNNHNLLLLYYSNSYIENNQEVILHNDGLLLDNLNIQNSTTSLDISLNLQSLVIQPLLVLFATELRIQGMQYQNNQGNIFASKSQTLLITDSFFENNLSLEGGALNIQSVSKVTIVKTIFQGNQAKGSGGAIYLYGIEFLNIDNESWIKQNTAEIGGGIRLIKYEGGQFKSDQILHNIAYIFGNNIGKYPSKIRINKVNEFNIPIIDTDLTDSLSDINQQKQIFSGIPQNRILQQNDLTQEINDSLNEHDHFSNNTAISNKKRNVQKKPTNDQNQLIITNIRSGDLLPLSVQLLDDEGIEVSFSVDRLRKNDYTQGVYTDLKSMEIEVQSQDPTKVVIVGEQYLNYNQFNLTEFQFLNLKIHSKPNTNQTILLSVASNPFSNLNSFHLQINISLRSCIIGEVQKILTKDIMLCEMCQSGQYSLANPNLLNEDGSLREISSCKKCPVTAELCEGSKIILKDGYWREQITSDQIYECNPNRKVTPCKEKDQFNRQGCIEGYVGPLCDQCDESAYTWENRYTYDISTQRCVKCGDSAVYYTYFIILSLLLILYLMLSVCLFMNNFTFHSASTYLRHMNLLPMSVSCMNDQSTFYMKQLITYLQLTSILLEESYNQKSNFLTSVSDYFGRPLSNVFVDSHCLYNPRIMSNYGVTQINIMVQGVYPIFFLAFLSLVFYYSAKYKLGGIKFYHNYATVTLLLMFFQPGLIRYYTKALSCRRIGDKRYLAMNLLLLCNDSSFRGFSNFFIIPYLILLLSLPLMILFKIYKVRSNLQYCINKHKFGYFYLDYKPSFYFWEFVRIYITAFIAIFFTLYKENDAQYCFQIICIFLCMYIIVNHILQPLLQKKLLKLESISMIVLIACILLQQLNMMYSSMTALFFLYFIHILYCLSVVTIIIHLKLRRINHHKLSCVKEFLRKVLHARIFHALFASRENKMEIFIRWKKIRKYVLSHSRIQFESDISKNQASLINLQKGSQNKEPQSIADSLVELPYYIRSSMNYKKNSEFRLLNQGQNSLKSSFKNLSILNNTTGRINNYEKYNSNETHQRISQMDAKFNTNNHLNEDVLCFTINDLENISQYEEHHQENISQNQIPTQVKPLSQISQMK